MSHLQHIALTLLATALPAQDIAGEFSPNPAPPGAPITLTCTDATGAGLLLSSGCGWYRIFQGSQNGPQIQLNVSCGQVIIPIAANGTFSFTWDQTDASGAQVPPGVYWVEARAWSPGYANQYTDWFCISIQPPGEPSLTAGGSARIGQNTPLQINAPSEANSIYVVAASLSSDNPISVPGLNICLDEPFSLQPFTSPVGALDANGNSSGLALVIPNAPNLLWQPLHVQSLIFGPNGLRVTNDVSFAIQP